MELTTRFDPSVNLRLHVLSGDVSFEELRTSLTALYNSADFHADQNSLWDLRNANLATISAAEVQEVAELVRGNWATSGNPKSALVVSRDVDFGMSRMYEHSLETEGNVQVFRDMQQAMDWVSGAGSPDSPA